MIPKRRFVIQLTPLLDLLLILVFALLLGLGQQGRTEEHRARSVVTEAVPELADQADPVSALVEQHRRDARALDQARDENARLVSQQDSQRRLADELAESKQRQERIGDLVSELFKIPPETLAKLLRAGPASRSKSNEGRLKDELRKLAEKRSSEVVKHLVTFDEMRKRFDLWDLVVDADFRYELKAGGETKSFQARTPAEFDDKLFRAYKELAQPKDLVIMMLAWHENADFAATEMAVEGLPGVTERMREDRSGQTQFQFLVLGLKQPAVKR